MNEHRYYKTEHFKISKLLNDSTISRFVTRKWIEWFQLNDLSNGKYSVDKNIRFKNQICIIIAMKYIIVKGTITHAGTNANNWTNQELAFKNASLVHAYQKSVLHS